MNLVSDAVKRGTTKSIITKKGYKRFTNKAKVSSIMDNLIL